MLPRPCTERITLRLVLLRLVLAGCLLGPMAFAQAPLAPEHPWPIPDTAINRAAALGDPGSSAAHRPYDLAGLVDLAERTNPKTREA